jgi:hypothetical protein
MRSVEFFLIVLPVLLVVGWFMGLRHAGYRAFAAIAGGLLILGVALVFFGQQRAFTGAYTPARLQNGQITHSAPP